MTGVKVDLKTLFMKPTVALLSDYVDTLRWMEVKDEIAEAGQEEIVF